MFTISTHDNNIKTCRFGHHHLLRLPEPVFCSFHWFWLAIIISISKMLVKKSTDLKLNLPLSCRLSLLWRSFSCGIGNLFLLLLLSFLFLSSLSSSSSDGVWARFLSDEHSTRSTR